MEEQALVKKLVMHSAISRRHVAPFDTVVFCPAQDSVEVNSVPLSDDHSRLAASPEESRQLRMQADEAARRDAARVLLSDAAQVTTRFRKLG